MKAFLTLWLGQTVSQTGSGLTRFALSIWVYQRTGSATLFGVVLTLGVLPSIVLGPVAGAVVDRADRRRVLIAANLAAASATLLVALLAMSGRLDLWAVYLAVALSATASAFQRPAQEASTTLLVPRGQLVRASGLVQSGQSAARIAAPAAAGALIAWGGLAAVLWTDLATFAVALACLAAVRIPPPPRPEPVAHPSWRAEMTFGWRYVAARPELRRLLWLFVLMNFCLGVAQASVPPLVLQRASEAQLGVLLSAAGVAMLAGSVLMAAWGGPARPVDGIYAATLAFGAALAALGAARTLPALAVAYVALLFVVPVINGCNQAVWQARVEPALQGRVFAARSTLAWSSTPLAYSLAGPLAERVFDPLAAAGVLPRLLGSGPGRGTALLLALLGAGSVAAGALSWRGRETPPRIARPRATAGPASACLSGDG